MQCLCIQMYLLCWIADDVLNLNWIRTLETCHSTRDVSVTFISKDFSVHFVYQLFCAD